MNSFLGFGPCDGAISATCTHQPRKLHDQLVGSSTRFPRPGRRHTDHSCLLPLLDTSSLVTGLPLRCSSAVGSSPRRGRGSLACDLLIPMPMPCLSQDSLPLCRSCNFFFFNCVPKHCQVFEITLSSLESDEFCSCKQLAFCWFSQILLRLGFGLFQGISRVAFTFGLSRASTKCLKHLARSAQNLNVFEYYVTSGISVQLLVSSGCSLSSLVRAQAALYLTRLKGAWRQIFGGFLLFVAPLSHASKILALQSSSEF